MGEDLADLKTPVIRPLVWMGNSRKNIQALPVDAQKLIGDEIQLIQFGDKEAQEHAAHGKTKRT